MRNRSVHIELYQLLYLERWTPSGRNKNTSNWLEDDDINHRKHGWFTMMNDRKLRVFFGKNLQKWRNFCSPNFFHMQGNTPQHWTTFSKKETVFGLRGFFIKSLEVNHPKMVSIPKMFVWGELMMNWEGSIPHIYGIFVNHIYAQYVSRKSLRKKKWFNF